jgi:hypothetical protein
MPRYGQILTLTFTTGDTALPIVTDPSIQFEDVNIHIYSNDAYYGDGNKVNVATQAAATPDCSVAKKDAVITFRHLILSTLFFKSYTSGSNAFIAVTGTLKGR